MFLCYPPLQVEVRTPRLSLCAATDDRLELLLPVVRAGVATTEPLPFDDPMSLYEDNPTREWRWLRGVWNARASVEPDGWRLNFVVMVDGAAAGIQDLIAIDFPAFGSVMTFSWLGPQFRGRGIGREMRSAILHLGFAGFEAREATSEAFVDNDASNAVSRSLGYEQNGSSWATRRGVPAPMCRWLLTRDRWAQQRRSDIELIGVEACRPVLGL